MFQPFGHSFSLIQRKFKSPPQNYTAHSNARVEVLFIFLTSFCKSENLSSIVVSSASHILARAKSKRYAMVALPAVWIVERG